MASSASLQIASLVMRIVTLVLLLISLIVLTTNTATLQISIYEELKLNFDDVYAYRYMLSTIVIGVAYSLLQIGLGIYQASQGSGLIRSNLSLTVDFYGDKIMSFVLATGAAAGFVVTRDLEIVFGGDNTDLDQFYQKGYASASMLLLAFLSSAIVSVISSYTLPKRQSSSQTT